MMASYNKPLCLFLISSLASICFICLSQGVTVDLIHSDSPLSPLYQPSETRFDRVKRAITHSFARQSQFKSILSTDKKSVKAIVTPLVGSGGGYIMRVGVGTPTFNIWAIADTGSDLAWTQCQPCTDCYKQDNPLFDPSKSTTYKNIPCSTEECRTFGAGGGSSCDKKGCAYQVQYGDQSSSHGSLATETFTFQPSGSKGNATFPNVAFGCGFSNQGTFNSKTSGIIGLGGGAVSIVNQLDKAVSGKFSYCLTPFGSNATSKISFGSHADVSGEGVVSTPIIKQTPDTFYFLTLESVTIGNQNILMKKSADPNQAGGGANIIIDSGTTLTFLPSDIYSDFESALEKAITGGQRVDAPQGFSLCFKSGDKLNVPTITANFAGAKLVLPQESIFLEVEDGVVCSTFVGADGLGGTAIFGNLHQVNYLVGYDLNAGKVSFKKTQCSS